MRGTGLIAVAALGVLLLLSGTAGAQVWHSPNPHPLPALLPKPGTPAAQELEDARSLRVLGIVLTSIAAAHVVTGVVLLGVGINIKNTGPPGRPPDNGLGPGFGLSVAGIAVSGGGALVYGIPGVACWIAGQVKINRAREALEGGLSVGPGPVASQGLSLRWRF
jgi:hypothetical protein